MIGASVTWAIHTWKQVADIKDIRSKSSKIPTFTEEDLKFFDTKIKKSIEEATESKVQELLGSTHKKDGRELPERKIHINWALTHLLALVERGLKVEIRLLSPPPREGEGEGEGVKISQAFSDLEKTIPELVFPRVEGPPVLDLPPPDPNTHAKPKPKAKPAQPTKNDRPKT